MRFWDSSAVIPLAVDERASRAVRDLIGSDDGVVIWALTPVEIAAALWRRQRSRQIDESRRADAQAAIDAVVSGAAWVADLSPVAARARRLVAMHRLRSADALQLAAALYACDERPDLLPFVTLDDRLADAATREGFRVMP